MKAVEACGWAITSNSTTPLRSADTFWHWAFVQLHFFYRATANFISSRHKSPQKWCCVEVVSGSLLPCSTARNSISHISQILISLITTMHSSFISSITCLSKQAVSATVVLGSHAISPICCNRFSAVYSCLCYCHTKSAVIQNVSWWNYGAGNGVNTKSMFKCVSQGQIYCEVTQASASGPLTCTG